METQICPSRKENPGPWTYDSGPDHWEKGTSLADHRDDERFRCCSFCGSVHPDDFMRFLKEGWILGPTDKNYKAYLGEPIEPYNLLGTIEISSKDVGKFYYEHLSEGQRKEFVDMLNQKAIKIGYPGHLYVRPFFVTLEISPKQIGI